MPIKSNPYQFELAELRPSRPKTRMHLGAALLVLCALFATACGGSDSGGTGNESSGGGDAELCPVAALDSADGPTKITIWHAWIGLTAQTLESIADSYNKSQDKVVLAVEAQGSYEELLKKYQDALGDPSSLPDIVLSEDTTTQFMIDSESIVPAQDCIAADDTAEAIYKNILPAVTAGYTVDDVLWPAAFSVSQPVLYVNQNHLAAAGVDSAPAALPATLEELRSTAEKIKAANIPGVEQPLVLRLDSWYLEQALAGVQQPVVNNSNGRSGLATESELKSSPTTEVFEWFKSMQEDGLLKAIPYSDSFGQLFAMALQTSSMLIDTSTAITSVNAAIEGTLTNEDIGAADLGIDLSTVKFDTLKIGVGLNPGLKAAGVGQIGGAGWYMVKSGDDASIAAAWNFMKYFNETPQQVRWTLEASYLPVSESAREDPSLQEAFTANQRGQWLAVASSGLVNLDPEFPGPVIGPYNEFRSITRGALEKVTASGSDVAAVIATANTEFQVSLDQYASEVGG
ncbi:MAG: extracellular solute-binding protein [Microthrixaceae bacterium]